MTKGGITARQRSFLRRSCAVLPAAESAATLVRVTDEGRPREGAVPPLCPRGRPSLFDIGGTRDIASHTDTI